MLKNLLPFLLMGELSLQAADTADLTPYVYHFSYGHGRWFSHRHFALKIWDGAAQCYSPWFVDPNHVSLRAGYMHLVMLIYTARHWYQPDNPATTRLPYRASSFADQGRSTDLRNARLTVRSRGAVDLKVAQLLLLAQA